MKSYAFLEDYEFIKTIGKGTFGKVKLAKHKLTKEQVAIKILEIFIFIALFYFGLPKNS